MSAKIQCFFAFPKGTYEGTRVEQKIIHINVLLLRLFIDFLCDTAIARDRQIDSNMSDPRYLDSQLELLEKTYDTSVKFVMEY